MENPAMQKIVEFIHCDSCTIPDAVLAQAAVLLVDTIGVAAGSATMETGRIARDFTVNNFCAPPEKSTPILFDGRPASITGAAFAAASQIDNLDAHDGFNLVKGHIGCAVVPALIGWATKHPNLTGRDALAAMVVGYEIAARAGIALHTTANDYHTSGAWNALGVVATGARLAKANSSTLRHAFGIAEYHGPRSQMMREIANPTMLHDGSGMGAMGGVMALELAQAGFTGAPAITIEADDVVAIWQDLGTHWTLPLNYIKPYPVCRWAHPAIDAVRALQIQHGFTADDVKKTTIYAFKEATELYSSMPQTTSMAQYSLPFAVASMIRFGQIGPNQISGPLLHDPQTATLLKRITVEENAEFSTLFPATRKSQVVIELRNGTHFDSGPTEARGDFHTAMSIPDLREKFDQLAGVNLSTKRKHAIWESGFKLTQPEVMFETFTRHLIDAPD